MTTTHIEPPKDLPSSPGDGILRALVCPFGEPILPPHADAGHVFQWADVRLPVKPEAVSLNLDHDSESEVGMIVAAVKRRDGLWAALKVGLTAERLIAAGHIGVSPEIDENGELMGVALCVKGHAGLPSARIVDSLPSFTSAEAPAGRASVPSFPPIGLGSGKAPPAPEHKSPAWGQVGESKTIIGTGAKASDSEGPERSTDVPSPFAGRPVLLTPDPAAEVLAARRRFEEVREARKEWDSWPASMYRRMQEDYASQRRVPQGLYRSHSVGRPHDRRGRLELCHQPGGRQAPTSISVGWVGVATRPRRSENEVKGAFTRFPR